MKNGKDSQIAYKTRTPGGLPWMGYAANRERGMCQLIKEYVHGERETVEVGVNAEQEIKSKPSTGQSICQHNHKVTKDSQPPPRTKNQKIVFEKDTIEKNVRPSLASRLSLQM